MLSKTQQAIKNIEFNFGTKQEEQQSFVETMIWGRDKNEDPDKVWLIEVWSFKRLKKKEVDLGFSVEVY